MRRGMWRKELSDFGACGLVMILCFSHGVPKNLSEYPYLLFGNVSLGWLCFISNQIHRLRVEHRTHK